MSRRTRKEIVRPHGQPTSVGSVMKMFFKETGLGVSLREWEVVENWDCIAGERIAKVTVCEKVEKGKLYVRVMSAVWRQELAYLKDALKERIVAETGCESIKDIVFY